MTLFIGRSAILLASLLFLLVVVSVCSERDHDDEKEKELSNKEIKKQLKILTNEVMELKKKIPHKPNEEAEMHGGMKILSARRESISPGMIRFTVRYRVPNNLGFIRFWRSFDSETYRMEKLSETISNEIPLLGQNIEEVSVVTKAQNRSFVVFTCINLKMGMGLYLRNGLDGDIVDTNINLPVYKTEPEGDFVYEPGHDLQVKVTIPPESKRRPDPGAGYIPNRNIDIDYGLVASGRDDLMTKMTNGHLGDKFILEPEMENFLDKIEVTAQLNTSQRPYSGVISLTTGTNTQDGLVARVEFFREKVLRPSTQSGPYLEGKIYPTWWQLSFEGDKLDKDTGVVRAFCGYEDTCERHCSAYGDDLVNVKLYKTVNGRTTQEELEDYDPPNQVSYRKYSSYIAQPISEDGPSTATYSCVVENAMGQTRTFRTEITFDSRVKILANESRVQEVDGGNATVICTATKYANITINCDEGREATDRREDHGLDGTFSVTAVCTGVSPWSWLTCTASDEFSSDDTYFSLSDLHSEY